MDVHGDVAVAPANSAQLVMGNHHPRCLRDDPPDSVAGGKHAAYRGRSHSSSSRWGLKISQEIQTHQPKLLTTRTHTSPYSRVASPHTDPTWTLRSASRATPKLSTGHCGSRGPAQYSFGTIESRARSKQAGKRSGPRASG